jgi:hypothetical protein
MPEEQTKRRAEQKKREGKAPTTQAGEFVREEIHHAREGKHGVRSREQAIAIGLSKARRAGIDVPPPEDGSEDREGESAGSDTSEKAAPRSPEERSAAAKKGAETKGAAGRSAAAKKAAQTRARNRAR